MPNASGGDCNVPRFAAFDCCTEAVEDISRIPSRLGTLCRASFDHSLPACIGLVFLQKSDTCPVSVIARCQSFLQVSKLLLAPLSWRCVQAVTLCCGCSFEPRSTLQMVIVYMERFRNQHILKAVGLEGLQAIILVCCLP